MKLAAEPEREKDAPKSREAVYLLLDLVISLVYIVRMFNKRIIILVLLFCKGVKGSFMHGFC